MFDIGKTGGIFPKYIKFRVQFHPHKPLGASENSSTNTNDYKSFLLQQIGFTSIITFIPEKGSLSAFKAVCEKIQDEWRYVALFGLGEINDLYLSRFELPRTVDADTRRMRSNEINTTEGEGSFMIVQSET